MELFFHKKFQKQATKLSPKLQKRLAAQLRLFAADPFDQTLNNHALVGDLRPIRSINITGDVRAWYQVYDSKVQFLQVGTHGQLYGK